MTDNAPSPKTNIILGIIMIILGIWGLIVTYKYVLPIGSIFLIISGTFLVLIRNL